MHSKRIICNVLLLGVFTLLALGSASSSQERQENLDYIKKGYHIGTEIGEIFSENARPSENPDSVEVVDLKDVAIR